MGRSVREGYTFGNELKAERFRGVEGKCEVCERKTRLQGHHLISCFFAAHNPVLTPYVIRTIENVQMLCSDCHIKADEAHKHFNEHDIALLAWALFDLPPDKVEQAQNGTYLSGQGKHIAQYYRDNPRGKRRKNKRKGRGKRR